MNQTAPQPVKPGIKTTEFWLALIAQIIGGLMAAGVFSDESVWARILGVASVVLASMGYSGARGKAKAAGSGPSLLGILLALAILTASSAAQSGLPVVTIETSDQPVVAAWGAGGTVQAPHDLGGGFRSIDLPDGMGVLLITDGQDHPFKRITTDKRVIYTLGSRPLPGSFDGVEYIPDDPAAYRRNGTNEILGFEAIPVLFPNDRWEAPTARDRARVMLELGQTTRFNEIRRQPRLVRLIQNFDDRFLPEKTPFGQTDMGWQIRNYAYTFGGAPRVGWYNGVCPRGGDGFENWHYDALMWLALHYLNEPRPDLYRFCFQQALAHACYGRSWQGPYAGFARYEKGGSYIGQNYSDHDWAKQWSGGLIVWHRLTGNPVLGMQVDLMREQLRKSDPNTVWKGYWGARIGSHYLEELLAHYMNNRESWLADKARHFIANCHAWRNPDGTWPNLGNGGAAEESPWMQTQLVTAIFRWREQVPAMDEVFPLADLMRSGAAVWTLGSTREVAGRPMLKYRFITTDVLAPSMHLTAFAVPMLRYMSSIDHDAYDGLYDEVSSFVFNFAGTDMGGIVTGTPTPIAELGYRFPREGPGWAKAARFYLEAAR